MALGLIGFATGSPITVPEGSSVRATITVTNKGASGPIWVGAYLSYGTDPANWPGRKAFNVAAGADRTDASGRNALVTLSTGESRTLTFVSEPLVSYAGVTQFDAIAYAGVYDETSRQWIAFHDYGTQTGAINVTPSCTACETACQSCVSCQSCNTSCFSCYACQSGYGSSGQCANCYACQSCNTACYSCYSCQASNTPSCAVCYNCQYCYGSCQTACYTGCQYCNSCDTCYSCQYCYYYQ